MDIENSLDSFIQRLKLGNSLGSYDLAYKTIDLLLQICSDQSWKTAEELMSRLKTAGRKLISAKPSELTIGNMVRRVLKIVREEYARATKGNIMEDDPQESLQKMLLAEGDDLQYGTVYPELRESIIDAVGEVVTELENSLEAISSQALEHIHANEIIMTIGKSKTVEAFLKNAAKKRKFHVIVAECAPFYHGHEMATSLASAGIETTLTTDSAVFALMSRVNKVLLGTHSVMANGGLKAVSGVHALALTAKHHSVPVIVCSTMYKLCPQYVCSYDQEAFNLFVSPQAVLPYNDPVVCKVKVNNPVFDYVPPELITLYISNVSGYAPSYVYRLIGELYHPDDLEL